MNLILFAMRRPVSVLVVLLSLAIICFFAIRPTTVDTWLAKHGVELPLKRMPVDIFPALNLPVIYVCQPFGGMDPAQMEGLLTNYYEYHFLYIGGIHHVESRNVQGMALMKLFFHPGTNMPQAMAETINYVNRSRAFMPPGTVSPFVMRFDTGSVPVGYLVLSSPTRTVGEIQDQALFKIRPLFSALPGVSAPPPFGGSARSIIVRADPDRLRSYGMAPDELITAISSGNTVSPSGNLRVGDKFPVVPLNSMVKDIQELGEIPIRSGNGPPVFVRDVATLEDATDITTGYALVNGRRAVYILATKRADASTMSVIHEIKTSLPKMQKELPDDIRVSFEFDQSPYVTRAIQSLLTEGALGAVLTGLMVLLFLRDWRSALVVVLNIPLALMAAVVGLWIGGQTINLMTLGGLALAVGILVDEATVEIENIHSQFRITNSVARAVRLGNAQTAGPRLLAMLCVLAVFVPSFFMQGAPREMFVPLSMAVGLAMVASYLLSNTFVPVVSTWLLKQHRPREEKPQSPLDFAFYRRLYQAVLRPIVALRWLVVPAYVAACIAVIVVFGRQLGTEIFPIGDAGEFRLRMRAPDGTHINATEKLALRTLDVVRETVGAENVALTLGYVGTIPSSYPINGVYQWSRGPEEAILRIALRPASSIRTVAMQERLRAILAEQLPNVRFSFEPADIVSEVMSFGSPTPIEISARSASLDENRKFIARVQSALADVPAIRDVQVSQSLDYPTVNVRVDRAKASFSGVSIGQVARSMVAATSSSRFVVPNYWPDPKTGIGYQVQVEIPQPALTSSDDLGAVPVHHLKHGQVLLRDVAELSNGTMPGQFDRYNMKREISLTANLAGADLGHVARDVTRIVTAIQTQDDAEKDLADQIAVEKGTPKPVRITHELRGQIPPLKQMMTGLGIGLLLSVVTMGLLLATSFQSFRLSLVAVSTAPAVIAGVVLMLHFTKTTLNIQSFIGAIMAIGVAMANAILLITFAEELRRGVSIQSPKRPRGSTASDPEISNRSGPSLTDASGCQSSEAAIDGAGRRLRPILMTSFAMIGGMLPMALAMGEAGSQTAPLGRAVIGGLVAATCTTLLILPAVFALSQSGARVKSASLDPDDPDSSHFLPQTGSP